MRQHSGTVYRFGPFRYEVAQRVLFRHDDVVPLEPKIVDTLEALLDRRGEVVSRAELMRIVWPDCVVEDVGLARNISLLRRALGDDAEAYIETVPKRGYRFVAAMTGSSAPAEGEAPGSVAKAIRQTRRAFRTWPGAIVVLLTFGGVVYWQFYRPSRYLPSGSGAASLAVIPVVCLSPDLERARFSDGFAEVLAAEIVKLPSVEAVSPSTVHRYRQAGVPIALMARVLGLDVVVEGTAQTFGDHVRITVRLTDVHSGKLIWADRYDLASASLETDEASAAREIAAALRGRISSP